MIPRLHHAFNPSRSRGGFLRNLLPLLVLAAPALLFAQFQQPTSEELKMTADPKAPGAAAVYLYREETTDNFSHFRTVYERIKVLTEKGKEAATIRIPYEHDIEKVTDIQGRTIHADGTVIPLTAKPDDLMNYKTKGFQVNAIVFSLPSVEVGSILEYSLRIHFDYFFTLPMWQIQQPYFVHSAHYSFRPVITFNLMYASRLRNSVQVVLDKKHNYTLDITDVPPRFDEDWMPPMNFYAWRVEFYNSDFTSGEDFWNRMGDKWGYWVKDFTKPTGKLRDALATIVAPGDSEETKAKKSMPP